MKRRSFLGALGLVPVVAALPKFAEAKPKKKNTDVCGPLEPGSFSAGYAYNSVGSVDGYMRHGLFVPASGYKGN